MNIAIGHILTTRRNCLEFDFELILGKRLIINRDKYEWETLDTPKIKTVFYSHMIAENDYGTKLRIKCHQRIERKAETIESELCTNWELIDNFGIQLDSKDKIYYDDGYKKFYDNPWLGFGPNPFGIGNGFDKLFTLVKNCWTVYEA